MALPKQVVVVDDNELFCAKMVHFFEERYGDRVKVTTYTDPLKGLAGLEPNVDLLIVDLEMPMIDGKKFLQFALQKGVDRKKIIITSFRTAEELHAKFHLSEVLAVMDKNEAEQQKVFVMITDSIMRKP
jgi:CheY-like chemotaxis protein